MRVNLTYAGCMKTLKAEDWREVAPPGCRVYIGSGASCPYALVDSMLSRAADLRDIELVHTMIPEEAPWVREQFRETFTTNTFFPSGEVREAIAEGACDYTPCFLSEVPALFSERIMPLDLALVSVTPPDEYGFCSLGVAVEVNLSAVRSARRVVAQINPEMPRTFGETSVHVSEIALFLEAACPLPEWQPSGDDDTALRIGEYVAELIEDGSTLQIGIGNIPDRVCDALSGHRNLGVHSEMISDGLMRLFRAGVVDNSRKTLHRGKMVTSFCLGSKALYTFVNDNPHLLFRPTQYTNNIANIAQNEKMVALNSAVQIDLSGQVATDIEDAGFRTGIGGIVDFMRGAAMSPGGLPLIAMPSTACDGGVSRIVPELTRGAGVVGSRADVHYVVTEYGIATLRGRSIRERALELIQVAHPDFRDDLLRVARDRKWVPRYLQLSPLPVREIGGVDFKRVELAGEPYVLRPLHPSDERRLQEFFYSHTQDTIQRRYGYLVKSMTRGRAHELVAVDQEKDLALGVFEVKGPLQRIHAVGRYYLDPDGKSAEIAFVVREDKRRTGMGSLLLNRMLEVAKRRKLQSVWAQVASDNLPMLRLFQKYGAEIEKKPGHESVNIRFKFTGEKQ